MNIATNKFGTFTLFCRGNLEQNSFVIVTDSIILHGLNSRNAIELKAVLGIRDILVLIRDPYL
jgi:hypothetical protein